MPVSSCERYLTSAWLPFDAVLCGRQSLRYPCMYSVDSSAQARNYRTHMSNILHVLCAGYPSCVRGTCLFAVQMTTTTCNPLSLTIRGISQFSCGLQAWDQQNTLRHSSHTACWATRSSSCAPGMSSSMHAAQTTTQTLRFFNCPEAVRTASRNGSLPKRSNLDQQLSSASSTSCWAMRSSSCVPGMSSSTSAPPLLFASSTSRSDEISRRNAKEMGSLPERGPSIVSSGVDVGQPVALAIASLVDLEHFVPYL